MEDRLFDDDASSQEAPQTISQQEPEGIALIHEEPAKGTSRRRFLLGAGIAGLLVVGGGATWLALNRRGTSTTSNGRAAARTGVAKATPSQTQTITSSDDGVSSSADVISANAKNWPKEIPVKRDGTNAWKYVALGPESGYLPESLVPEMFFRMNADGSTEYVAPNPNLPLEQQNIIYVNVLFRAGGTLTQINPVTGILGLYVEADTSTYGFNVPNPRNEIYKLHIGPLDGSVMAVFNTNQQGVITSNFDTPSIPVSISKVGQLINAEYPRDNSDFLAIYDLLNTDMMFVWFIGNKAQAQAVALQQLQLLFKINYPNATFPSSLDPSAYPSGTPEYKLVSEFNLQAKAMAQAGALNLPTANALLRRGYAGDYSTPIPDVHSNNYNMQVLHPVPVPAAPVQSD